MNFFAYLKASSGTINPALKRLENLGCVEYTKKMTDGGMLSKMYSITPTGKKHLVDLLLSINEKNPYHIINTIVKPIKNIIVISIVQREEVIF